MATTEEPTATSYTDASTRGVTADNAIEYASNTIEAMAHGAIAFIEAMELDHVDLLGFSIGSFVAQELALIRPPMLFAAANGHA